jgi:hypothetical protein
VDFKGLIAIEMQISCSTQNQNESIQFDNSHLANKLPNRSSTLRLQLAAADFNRFKSISSFFF